MKQILVVIIAILSYGGVTAQAESVLGYSLISDLGDSSATVSSVRMLLENTGVYSMSDLDKSEILENKDGLVILVENKSNSARIKKIIRKYVNSGGIVVMDIRSFAQMNGYTLTRFSVNDIMVSEESPLTQGYKKGDPIRYSAGGNLYGIKSIREKKRTKVLGRSRNGDILLAEQRKGKGRIITVDMISLKEPEYGADTENKYMFMVNALGNGTRVGANFPRKYHYAEFLDVMREIDVRHAAIVMKEEGDASGGYKIFSLNLGKPDNPGILIYCCTHGNEWENAFGAIHFARYLAENPNHGIIDPEKYFLKIIPVLNPYGYENMTRQNGNKVDLNRNGGYRWDEYKGVEPGDYKPGSYDWKGSAPFSEPESQTLRKIVESGNYHALIDIHGNPSGTGYNKWMGIAWGSKPDAYEKGQQFREFFNESIKGRYVLKQKHEKAIKHFVIENIENEKSSPNLYNSLSDQKYGYIVEILCGYSSTEFIVMQSDILCELCIAFCRTFAK